MRIEIVSEICAKSDIKTGGIHHMSAQHLKVKINSAVFRWATAGSGWEEKELSERTDIKLKSIQEWGRSNTLIKVSDLKKISKVINRPISVLLLSEPPDEKEPTDYRRIDRSDTAVKISRKTLEVIRRARYVQANAGELLEMRSEDVQPNIIPRTLQDDPERVAETERKTLGLDLQRSHVGEKIDKFVLDVYTALREKIESFNIFVMQMSMDISDARGFVISDKYPKVIVINSKDEPRTKLFTLLHEYAHLLLRTDGICLANPNYIDGQHKGQNMLVERWCNIFAGAVIMPRKAMLRELEDMRDRPTSSVIDLLANKFCASKTATIVRILNLLDGDPRWVEYKKHYKTNPPVPTTKRHGGGGKRNMAKECTSHNGRRYVRLVSDSRKRDLITINDMVMYLDLNIKHFEKLEGMI